MDGLAITCLQEMQAAARRLSASPVHLRLRNLVCRCVQSNGFFNELKARADDGSLGLGFRVDMPRLMASSFIMSRAVKDNGQSC